MKRTPMADPARYRSLGAASGMRGAGPTMPWWTTWPSCPAVWLVCLVLSQGFVWGWYLAPFFVLFWAVLTYLVLLRLLRILTSIYVPDYFIGRAGPVTGCWGIRSTWPLLAAKPRSMRP